LLAGEDGEQRLALSLVGPLVDDQEGLAAAFMDRSRPLHHGDGLQAVQLHLAEVAFLDGEAADGLAEAVRRQRIELAPAAIGAVAGDQLVGLNIPGNHDGASSVMWRLDEVATPHSWSRARGRRSGNAGWERSRHAMITGAPVIANQPTR